MRKSRLIFLLSFLLAACTSIIPSPTPTPTRTPIPTATATATPSPTPTPIFGEQILDQALAMAPSARADLAILPDLPQYFLAVEIDWQNHSFSGQGKIFAMNEEDEALDEIYLRLYPNGHLIYGDGDLLLDKLLINGREISPEKELGGSALRVLLPQPWAVGEDLLIETEFHGRLGEDDSSYGIYSYRQGIMIMADWYPLLAVYDEEGWNVDPVYGWGDAVYSDLAFYQVQVTTSPEIEVVATGVRAESEEENNQSRHVFVSGPAREFTLVLSNGLDLRQRAVGETTVNAYFPQGANASGEVLLEHAAGAIELFSGLFGAYPYAELDVLEVPMDGAGGMEYPGLLLIDELSVAARVISHEVAHQWWYGVVGNDILDEPWLDEALATYSSWLYMESAFGSEGYESSKALYQERWDEAQAINPNRLVTDPVSAFAQGGYFGIVYAKGSFFYDALREMLGPEVFYAALSDYYSDLKYRTATAPDLLGHLEAAAGQDLDEFFQEWLFSP